MKEILFQILVQICIYPRGIYTGILKTEIIHITIELTLVLLNPAENGNCSSLLFSCTFLLSLLHYVNDPKNSDFSKATYNGRIIYKNTCFWKGQPIN